MSALDPKKEIIRILTELDNALTDAELELEDLLEEADDEGMLTVEQYHAIVNVILHVDRSPVVNALEALTDA